MRDKPDAQPAAAARAPDASLEGRLDSWKEIAAHLGRGIRTVQRWERDEGLPVHRLAHDKRGSIYARKDELAAWWESRRRSLANPAAADAVDSPLTPRLERITRASAMTSWPALSSDARLLAYVSDAGQEGQPPQIWIQQIGGAAIRLTNAAREYANLSFSADDTRILFTGADASGQHVYDVPALGGEPRVLYRAASSARPSPDGQWIAWAPIDASGVRISAVGDAGFRTIGSELVDVSTLAWTPDSQFLTVQARSNPMREPDYWMIPVGGGPAIDLELNRTLRERGLFPVPGAAGWVENALVFAALGPIGLSLHRQRVARSPVQLTGTPEQLTIGLENASLPATAANRVAFVSSSADTNLWSLPIDANGLAAGTIGRLTRGAGPILFLTVTRDFRTLAYFTARIGVGDIARRNLETGIEKVVTEGPPGSKGYPAISPSGRQLAFGTRVGERRPIFVADLVEGSHRQLGEDCGGRPRHWIDERFLLIERFARFNAIAVIDTETGEQRDLLAGEDRSFKNARLSPSGTWIAFDETKAGGSPSVMVARCRADALIPESECTVVDRSASHPFWSSSDELLYYVPTGANAMIRNTVRARHLNPESGLPHGEPIPIYTSTEMVMPAFLPGTAPVATPNQIIFVLGDFRGDVWLLDLS